MHSDAFTNQKSTKIAMFSMEKRLKKRRELVAKAIRTRVMKKYDAQKSKFRPLSGPYSVVNYEDREAAYIALITVEKNLERKAAFVQLPGHPVRLEVWATKMTTLQEDE